MAKLSHIVEYSFTVLFMRIMARLPRLFGERLAAGLGSLTYRLWGSRRRIALDNIERALGDSVSEARARQIARSAFQNITRTFVDMAHFVHTDKELVRKMVVADDADVAAVREACQTGRGVIFVTAHFGNWEILGMWAAAVGLPINVLTGVQHNALVDRYVHRLRERVDVRVLKADRKGSLEVIRALKRGEIIGIVADQHAAVAAVKVTFFGRPVAAPKGPAAFAVRAGCPVWPFLSRRDRWDRHVMIPGKPIYRDENLDNESAIKQMTQAYTRFFEDQIRLYPEQWMWTHRRWKLREDEQL